MPTPHYWKIVYGNRLEKALGTGFQLVPANRDQWPRLKTPGFSTGALGFHWYRLERPSGTKEAATLTQGGSPFGTGWSFQPVPMTFSIFSQIQFCLLYLLLFILL